MDQLHVVYDYTIAHWGIISFLLVTLGTNISNMLMTKHPTEAGKLRELVNRISFTTSKDFPAWQMKMPLGKGPTLTTPSSSEPPAIPPAVGMIAILIFTFGLSGCVKAQNVGRNCGLPEVVSLIGAILPEVVTALVTANFGPLLDDLISTLTNQGVKDSLGVVRCAIKNLVGNSRAMKNERMITVRQNASLWLAAHPEGAK